MSRVRAKFQPTRLKDCTEGKESGHYPGMNGFYQAQPTTASQPIQLFCDSQIDLFVLVHWHADVNFNVSKALYVSGFGTATTDYWIGLEKLHLVTSSPYVYTLAVQVSNVSNDPFYQHYYEGFKVKGAAEGYAMTFTSHYNVTNMGLPMGDCFTPLMDIPFSTSDDDNDANPSRNCAADYGGGWWFNSNCSQCNLVGQLRTSTLTRVPGAVDEVFWLPGLPPDFSPNDASVFLFR